MHTETTVDQRFCQLHHDHEDLGLRSVLEVKITKATVVELVLVEDFFYAAVLRSSE